MTDSDRESNLNVYMYVCMYVCMYLNVCWMFVLVQQCVDHWQVRFSLHVKKIVFVLRLQLMIIAVFIIYFISGNNEKFQSQFPPSSNFLFLQDLN